MFDYYYEITKENSIFADYFQYLDDDEKMRAGIKSFKEEYGIIADAYIYTNGQLWVKPEENEQYADQFCKTSHCGYSPFKKNSPVGKAFTAAGIKKAVKPFLPWCFKNSCGRSQVRLFDYKDKLYAQYSPEFEVAEIPKGFIPMKASDFYKIIEEMEQNDGRT